MSAFAARYFDGRSATAHGVRATIRDGTLLIMREDGTPLARWAIGDVVILGHAGEEGVARITARQAPEARLEVGDADALQALATALPQSSRLRQRRRHAGYWLGLTAGAAAFIGALYLAIDRLPTWMAPLVPASWEAWLGDQVIESFATHSRYCDNPGGVAALAGLARRLSAAAELDPPVEVRVVDWKMVNAFAAPGGRIAILKGLIEQAEDANEVAGVLAHEMGHVVHHHPTEGLLRQLGLMATIQMLVGGSATGIEDAAGMGQMLLTLRYGRSAEAQADATAIALLERAGIDGHGLNRFFARMEKADKVGGAVPTLLLTHPPTKERLAATAKAADGGPALSEAEWQALKQICKD